ncbi:MAG: hypothetical protein QXD03_02465 [Candidatus Anstonellales archaeon]
MDRRVYLYREYIKSVLEAIKEDIGENRYKLYVAIVDNCDDFEELRELAELEMQLDTIAYIRSLKEEEGRYEVEEEEGRYEVEELSEYIQEEGDEEESLGEYIQEEGEEGFNEYIQEEDNVDIGFEDDIELDGYIQEEEDDLDEEEIFEDEEGFNEYIQEEEFSDDVELEDYIQEEEEIFEDEEGFDEYIQEEDINEGEVLGEEEENLGRYFSNGNKLSDDDFSDYLGGEGGFEEEETSNYFSSLKELDDTGIDFRGGNKSSISFKGDNDVVKKDGGVISDNTLKNEGVFSNNDRGKKANDMFNSVANIFNKASSIFKSNSNKLTSKIVNKFNSIEKRIDEEDDFIDF